ncbi:MAG: Ldh family oxidoreductase [Pseudomonadota bacterium]
MGIPVTHTCALDLASACLGSAGFEPDIAEAVAGHLVEAEFMGVPSHGLHRLGSYIAQVRDGRLNPNARPECTRKAGGLLMIDGCRGLGIPAFLEALRQGMDRADAQGIAAVAVRNCGHAGRLGAFANQAADSGYASIIVGGGGRHKWPNVCPHGSARGALSTNPFTFGFPGLGGVNLVSDFSTSSIATGKLSVAAATGSQLGEGVAVDSAGQPTRSAEAVLDGGALLPMAAHKGSAMAVFAEHIAEAMIGPALEFNWLLILLKCGGFRQMKAVLADGAKLSADLRALEAAPGHDRVRLPGDVEREAYAKAAEHGIELPEGIWRVVCEAAVSVGVDPAHYIQAKAA